MFGVIFKELCLKSLFMFIVQLGYQAIIPRTRVGSSGLDRPEVL